MKAFLLSSREELRLSNSEFLDSYHQTIKVSDPSIQKATLLLSSSTSDNSSSSITTIQDLNLGFMLRAIKLQCQHASSNGHVAVNPEAMVPVQADHNQSPIHSPIIGVAQGKVLWKTNLTAVPLIGLSDVMTREAMPMMVTLSSVIPEVLLLR